MTEQKGYIARAIDFARLWYRTAVETTTPSTEKRGVIPRKSPYRQLAEVPEEPALVREGHEEVSVLFPELFEYLRKSESKRIAGNYTIDYSGGYKIRW